MPQMAPSLWLILMTVVTIMIVLFTSFIYATKTSYAENKDNIIDVKMNNWKL